MINAILSEDVTQITKLASTPYVDVNEDLTNKPGAGAKRSYLNAAMDYKWPPLYSSARALFQAGEDPNQGINVLPSLIQVHPTDPELVKATAFLLDNKLNPDAPGLEFSGYSLPMWLPIILHECRVSSPILSQVLASFSSHGARFSDFHSPVLGGGNMFHFLAYAVDGWQEGSALFGSKVVNVCPYDWTVIPNAQQMLSEMDQFGNRPIDLIGFFNGYPQSTSCIYYTKWPYKEHLNVSVFTDWTNLFLKLGSVPARPPNDPHSCLPNNFGL